MALLMETAELRSNRRVEAGDHQTRKENLCSVSPTSLVKVRRRLEEETTDLDLVPTVAVSCHFQWRNWASCLWQVAASQMRWA